MMLQRNLITNCCFENEVEISRNLYEDKVSELKEKTELAMNVKRGLILIADISEKYKESVEAILQSWDRQEVEELNDN